MTRQQPSDAQLRSVIDNTLHGVIFTDASGRIAYHNGSAARLFGYADDELCGLDIGVLIPAELGVAAAELPEIPPRNLILAFTDATSDVRARRRDGSEFVVDLTLSRTDVDGDTLYSMVLVDITARLAAEAEKQRLHVQLAKAHKLESVGQLAAGVAHEINTPTQYLGDNLHFVKGSLPSMWTLVHAYRDAAKAESEPARAAALAAADALAAKLDVDYLAEEMPRAIEQALEGAEQIAGIVSAMKAFCHPGRPEKESVDLNAAVENTVNVSRNEWKYVAKVDCDLARDLPRVMCNGNEIKQVLLNLIVNAAQAIEEKYGTRSGIRGTIRLTTRRAGDFAEIEVRDDGPGIPEHVMPRLFEPFFTTKGVGKGTGQGLAIAHSIIADGHDGEIAIQSEPGSGTAFVLRLPL